MKVNEWYKIHYTNSKLIKAGVAILTTDKVDLKTVLPEPGTFQNGKSQFIKRHNNNLFMPNNRALKCMTRTSLVAQWLRIHLPMQGTQVQSLVWEDPTCCGATKPMSHNYWARTPQLLKPTSSRARVPQLLSLHAATTEACAPRACALQQEKPLQWEASALQWRGVPAGSN